MSEPFIPKGTGIATGRFPELTEERRARAIAASVAASEARKRADNTVDWDEAIKRLRALLRRQYAKGAMSGHGYPNEPGEGE